MKNIKLAFIALVAGLTGLWFLADTFVSVPFSFFSSRFAMVQYTGVMAVGAMSAAVLLALRPKWLEPRLNGLDKAYRLHKWLGITALVFAVIHWWLVAGTRWTVGWGWSTRPERTLTERTFDPIESWLRTQRSLAETLGEWASDAAVVLIFLALWKRFPYHLFARTHKWLAAIYLVLAYHAVILLRFAYWSQPIGWAVAILLASGAVAALFSLLGLIGLGRKARGVIELIIHYPELRVLETSVRLEKGSWLGHNAGQFAFRNSQEGRRPAPLYHSLFVEPERTPHRVHHQGARRSHRQVQDGLEDRHARDSRRPVRLFQLS